MLSSRLAVCRFYTHTLFNIGQSELIPCRDLWGYVNLYAIHSGYTDCQTWLVYMSLATFTGDL